MEKNNQKTKILIRLIAAIVITCGLIGILIVGYMQGFQIWTNLLLFAFAALTVVSWSFFYFANESYKESLDPKTLKRMQGKGNRRQRRKSK